MRSHPLASDRALPVWGLGVTRWWNRTCWSRRGHGGDMGDIARKPGPWMSLTRCFVPAGSLVPAAARSDSSLGPRTNFSLFTHWQKRRRSGLCGSGKGQAAAQGTFVSGCGGADVYPVWVPGPRRGDNAGGKSPRISDANHGRRQTWATTSSLFKVSRSEESCT